MSAKEREGMSTQATGTRRGLVKKIGKAALAVPPAVTMIMAATRKPAKADPPYWAPAHGWRKKTGNTDWAGSPGSRGKK